MHNQATAHPRTPATLCTQAGVALFKGRLHYRCAFPGASEDSGEFCSIDGAPDTCAAVVEGAECTYFADNRLDGPMNFDDIGAASLVIMQCASFDAYTQGMYVLMRHVFSLTWLYYLLIVCIGGFFVVNLFLAVLLEEFLQAKQAPSRTAALPVVHLPAHRQCPSSPHPSPSSSLREPWGYPSPQRSEAHTLADEVAHSPHEAPLPRPDGAVLPHCPS